MRRVYLDNAASTRVDERVLKAMLPYLGEDYGNPNSQHSFGAVAHRAVERSLTQVAQALGTTPEELRFTSGGSASVTLAILGAALARQSTSNRIITTPLEHHSGLSACEVLADAGFEIELLPVDAEGFVAPDDFARALAGGAALASIIHVQNEIGTVEPIAELGALAREAGVPLHVDAVQSFGHISIDVNTLNCDLLSISGHKCYAPKGIGALYVARGTRLDRHVTAPHGDNLWRQGTPNVPGIVGLGEAAALAQAELAEGAEHEAALRDQLLDGLLQAIPGARLSGPRTRRAPNNVAFTFSHLESESLVLKLDAAGLAASGGSACASGTHEASHVLRAIGVPTKFINGALRLTLGRFNTEADIDFALEVIPQAVSQLRAIAPHS